MTPESPTTIIRQPAPRSVNRETPPRTHSSQELGKLCEEIAARAKNASRILARASTAYKDRWLVQSAEAIEAHSQQILEANLRDVEAAPGFNLTPAQIDRLTLTPDRLRAASKGLRHLAMLPDPVGELRGGGIRPNGLQVAKVGVPLGVIFFIYESRPNVTVDAAGLCIKSGNAIILRGGSEAFNSNMAIHGILVDQLQAAGLPPDALQMVPTTDRDAIGHLLERGDTIDLTIPRGGKSLINRVANAATMPVLKHYDGNCHLYVDRHADLNMAERIIVNAKCQRPGVCNALESLIVHTDVADRFLPILGAALSAHGVEIRGCPRTQTLISTAKRATHSDFDSEYLDLILSIAVVADLDSAIEHITIHGSKHTDAIITNDLSAAREFALRVDTAAVMINTSTRFNDGFELGLGAEIGISTDKFHARGPCGLRELTSYKYIVTGNGQIRE